MNERRRRPRRRRGRRGSNRSGQRSQKAPEIVIDEATQLALDELHTVSELMDLRPAELLEAAGVDTALFVAEGGIHSFYTVLPKAEISVAYWSSVFDFTRRVLAEPR